MNTAQSDQPGRYVLSYYSIYSHANYEDSYDSELQAFGRAVSVAKMHARHIDVTDTVTGAVVIITSVRHAIYCFDKIRDASK